MSLQKLTHQNCNVLSKTPGDNMEPVGRMGRSDASSFVTVMLWPLMEDGLPVKDLFRANKHLKQKSLGNF